MTAGDRIQQSASGRCGVVDEFLHDGDALVTWDDGAHEVVRWGEIEPAAADTSDIS